MTGGFPKSASALAIAAAAGLLIANVTLTPSTARAADLGGDCCADLEERVAELEATTARKGNKKVSLTISGRVHANVMYWNDNSNLTDPNVPFDHHSDFYFGNTAGSGSNIVLNGSGRISGDVSAGFLMTLADDFGGVDNQFSHQIGPVLLGDTTYVFLSSKQLGELRLGNMVSASDNGTYLNFGAATVGGLAGGRFTGSFRLRDTAGQLTDITYSQILHEWSDNNENRLMYISPNLGGFKLYADIGGDDTASAALAWVGRLGTVNAEVGAGYQQSSRIDGVNHQAQFTAKPPLTGTGSTAFDPLTDTANSTLRVLAVSGSVWDTNSGLFLSAEYGKAYSARAGRQDISNWFVEGGWQKNVSGLGLTSIYAQYNKQYNGLRNDTTGHLFGVGIDQAIDSAATNIYLHYQRDTYETDGAVPNAAASLVSALPTLNTAGPVNGQAIDSVTGGVIIHF
jgi:hypothetical protein